MFAKINLEKMNFICMLLVTWLMPIHAHGATVLDQSFTPTSSFVLVSPHGIWQSFTAGVSGRLDSIEVLAKKNDRGDRDLIIEIWDTSFTSLLGSSSLTAPQVQNASGDAVEGSAGWVGTFISLDFSADNIALQSSEQYFIRMDQGPGISNIVSWMGSTAGSYIGGESISGSQYDYGFRTNMSVVPLPTSIFLFISGFMLLVVRARKR